MRRSREPGKIYGAHHLEIMECPVVFYWISGYLPGPPDPWSDLTTMGSGLTTGLGDEMGGGDGSRCCAGSARARGQEAEKVQ
jgi:hypothetical protein